MSVIGSLPVRVVDRLIVSRKWPVGGDDALEPFDGCHRVPTGHNCAYRKPMLWRQIFAIYFVREQHVAARFLYRNAAREFQFPRRTLRILKNASVGSLQNYLAGVRFKACSIK